MEEILGQAAWKNNCPASCCVTLNTKAIVLPKKKTSVVSTSTHDPCWPFSTRSPHSR